MRGGPAPSSRCAWSASITWTNPATAPFARAASVGISSTRCAASITLMPSSRANDSTAETVASPIPRFGMLTTRRNEMTSCGFSNRRR